MSKRRLSEEEQKVWDRVRKSVRPLKPGRPTKAIQDPGDPGLLKRSRSAPAAHSSTRVGSVGPIEPKRSAPVPQDRGSEKKIRRGKMEVSASFDLHGHTQESAWSALPAFLIREQARGSRCVIVITGKGKLGEGVLRRNFLHWLDMPEARRLVSGYAQAHPRHGGKGAFYVFIRRR